MKSIQKHLAILLVLCFILFNSCRTEDLEVTNPPQDQTLTANSAVANLMQRTASNDGSNDNIIDNANCFNIQLPVTVVVNDIEITINSETDFDIIEAIFDEFDDDEDTIEIQFPITIILSDFSEIVINNASDLDDFSDDCNDENEEDDDIECIDFVYPITASVFNTNNEVIATVPINNDNQLYNFIDDIGNNGNVVVVQFPITVILSDGTEQIVNDLIELEIIISNAEDDCDEDDDYDYDDDDCNDCSDSQLIAILTDCSNWDVDKFKRNNTNLQNNYNGYLFNFLSDNTITVTSSANDYTGTWAVSETENAITIAINISGLPDFNDLWNLHEIREGGNVKVDLRLGDDTLRFKSGCD